MKEKRVGPRGGEGILSVKNPLLVKPSGLKNKYLKRPKKYMPKGDEPGFKSRSHNLRGYTS